MRQEIIEAIDRERAYQDRKWGPPHHDVPAWILVLRAELAEAEHAWVKSGGNREALKEILQVIAVGVACLEQHGIFER